MLATVTSYLPFNTLGHKQQQSSESREEAERRLAMDHTYDTLLELFPSSLVTNIVGVFGNAGSDKTRFIDSVLRLELNNGSPPPNNKSLAGRSSAPEGPARPDGACSSSPPQQQQQQRTPHLRYVKPVTSTMLADTLNNTTRINISSGDDGGAAVERHEGPKHSHTFCPIVKEEGGWDSGADGGGSSNDARCTSMLPPSVYAALARRVGFEYVLPQAFAGYHLSSSVHTRTTTATMQQEEGGIRQLGPMANTSITLVDADAALAAMVEISGAHHLIGSSGSSGGGSGSSSFSSGGGFFAMNRSRNVNAPAERLLAINRHRLLTTAIVEYDHSGDAGNCGVDSQQQAPANNESASVDVKRKKIDFAFFAGRSQGEAEAKVHPSPPPSSPSRPSVLVSLSASDPLLVPLMQRCHKLFVMLPTATTAAAEESTNMKKKESAPRPLDWFREAKVAAMASTMMRHQADSSDQVGSSLSSSPSKISIDHAMWNVLPILPIPPGLAMEAACEAAKKAAEDLFRPLHSVVNTSSPKASPSTSLSLGIASQQSPNRELRGEANAAQPPLAQTDSQGQAEQQPQRSRWLQHSFPNTPVVVSLRGSSALENSGGASHSSHVRRDHAVNASTRPHHLSTRGVIVVSDDKKNDFFGKRVLSTAAANSNGDPSDAVSNGSGGISGPRTYASLHSSFQSSHDTYATAPPTVCDVVRNLYLSLLKRRVASAPPPQSLDRSLLSGSIPHFANNSLEEDANEERLVASMGLAQKCPGFGGQ